MPDANEPDHNQEPASEPESVAVGPAETPAAKISREKAREQAREQAELERAEKEARALRAAQELARADAERLLGGPGLIAPDPPIPPDELEAGWSPTVVAALRDLRSDLDSHRVGLAISGGGSLGSFEAGALRFLYDHTKVRPVAIGGISAGALNGAKLAEGDGEGERPIDEVERIWRSMRINSDMWEPEPWLMRLQASASWAAELREQVSDSDSAASAVRVAVRVVGSLVRRPPETDGTLEAIRDSLRAQSLLSLAPIAELVRRELRPDRVRSSGIALRMGTVSLEAGELRYVTETGQLVDRHDRPVDQPPVDLASGVLASASIPLAFPPVVLNDEYYVDGGAREILPLELLVERMGVQRVIAVSASSASIKRAPSFADRNMIDILRRVSAEIGPNETLRKELDPPGGWRPEVRLVVPHFNVHDSMTIDPALIAISLDHGYLRAADVLLRLGPDAADLTDRITRIRVELRHLAGPVPTIFDTTLGLARLQFEEPAETVGTADRPGNGNGDSPASLTADQAEPTEPATPDPSEPDESMAQRAADSVVKAAKDLTASGKARLASFIAREEQEWREGHDGQGHIPTGKDTPGTGTVEGATPEDGRPAPTSIPPDIAPVTPLEAVERAAEVPLAEAAANLARQAQARADQAEKTRLEANAIEIGNLTAELRDLVERRLALGYPLPPTLVSWLAET